MFYVLKDQYNFNQSASVLWVTYSGITHT